MAKSSNVRSLEALREFRVALIHFIDKAKRAVSTSDSEVMRTQLWLQSQQPAHWIQEIRKAEEKLAQAKNELFRAKISQPDNPRGPTEQVLLVRKRKAELAHAQQKLEKTNRWSRTFERSTNEYRGVLSPLSSALDGSAQKTVVLIEQSIATLESYLSTKTTSATEELSTTQTTSIARKGEEQTKDPHDEHANSDSTTDKSDKDPEISMEPGD